MQSPVWSGSCREACWDKRGLHVLRRYVHDSKTNGWYVLRNPWECPAFVSLLCRSCPTEGNTSAQNSHVAETPIILTAMHNWTIPTLTSCHVCRGDKCDAPCTFRTRSFHSSVAGTWSCVPLYTTTPASSSSSRPRNICSACLSEWHLPRRSPPFIAEATSSSVGSPALPKMLAAVANRPADTASKVPSSSDMVRANDDDDDAVALRLPSSWKWKFGGKPRGTAPGAAARLTWTLITRAFPIGNPHSNEIDLHLRY